MFWYREKTILKQIITNPRRIGSTTNEFKTRLTLNLSNCPYLPSNVQISLFKNILKFNVTLYMYTVDSGRYKLV